MAADLAILVMGPNWTGYYVFTIFNFLYAVGIFTTSLVAFEMTWADPLKLQNDYKVDWAAQAG